MRAEWTVSGACTSGSTVPPRDATRRASGGATMTSTTSTERREITTHGFRATFTTSLLRPLRAALRRQRGADDRLVPVHVGHGTDVDARRLDDVDGLDADARTDLAGRRGIVPRHVGCDDDGDDAAVLDPDVVALPTGPCHDGREALPPERTRWRGLLLRLDCAGNCYLSGGRRAVGDRNAATDARARRTDRGLCGLHDRWCAAVHRVEGTSPRLLQANTGGGPYATGRGPRRLAIRAAP